MDDDDDLPSTTTPVDMDVELLNIFQQASVFAPPSLENVMKFDVPTSPLLFSESNQQHNNNSSIQYDHNTHHIDDNNNNDDDNNDMMKVENVNIVDDPFIGVPQTPAVVFPSTNQHYQQQRPQQVQIEQQRASSFSSHTPVTAAQEEKPQVSKSRSAKRSGGSSGGGGIRKEHLSAKRRMEMATDPEEKLRLKKRLARKAELARSSRQRKKAYVQDLENKVKELGKKLEEMQAHSGSSTHHEDRLTQETRECHEKHCRIRESLRELLKRQPHELSAEQNRHLEHLVSEFVQNSRRRQAQFAMYLELGMQCLTPGSQARFALWGLTQPPEFYSESGLWKALMLDEVQSTPEQVQQLLSLRQDAAQERRALRWCHNSMKDVTTQVRQHVQRLNTLMDRLTAVYTPFQLAKFYLWVDDNQWVMDMLPIEETSSSQQQQQQQQQQVDIK